MNKERLYPEIEKVEKVLGELAPGQQDQAAIGVIGSLLYMLEQEQEMPEKGAEVLGRIRTNFGLLFSAKEIEGRNGWKKAVHDLGCDMARLKMVIIMHPNKK